MTDEQFRDDVVLILEELLRLCTPTPGVFDTRQIHTYSTTDRILGFFKNTPIDEIHFNADEIRRRLEAEGK